MAFKGMNTAQARALERKLDNDAQNLIRIAGDLRAKVDGTPWLGPDARRFKGETWGQIDTLLRDVSATLSNAQATIASQRQQQETASQI